MQLTDLKVNEETLLSNTLPDYMSPSIDDYLWVAVEMRVAGALGFEPGLAGSDFDSQPLPGVTKDPGDVTRRNSSRQMLKEVNRASQWGM